VISGFLTAVARTRVVSGFSGTNQLDLAFVRFLADVRVNLVRDIMLFGCRASNSEYVSIAISARDSAVLFATAAARMRSRKNSFALSTCSEPRSAVVPKALPR
jgi:hypothetical protein